MLNKSLGVLIALGPLLQGCATPVAKLSPGHPAPAASTAVDPGVDPDLVKAGYEVKHRDGRLFYCRSESSVGTRFATTTCLTAQQIHERERATQQSKDFLSLPRTGQCVGAECHQ
ncbi:MAG: hypothetical protein JO341_13855 [Gammaproteobacteria bacterium]|nr:hypothetical protein [Gammaproteobacteria bacterium]